MVTTASLLLRPCPCTRRSVNSYLAFKENIRKFGFMGFGLCGLCVFLSGFGNVLAFNKLSESQLKRNWFDLGCLCG